MAPNPPFGPMMRFLGMLFLALAVGGSSPQTAEEYLRLTSLITNDEGKSEFQCWEISAPFVGYPTVGQSISGFAAVSNVSYVVLPPGANEGIHNPPHPMFFVLLAGSAHMTLPDGDDELWTLEGINGIMIAADATGTGHISEYHPDKPTVALQIPFENGVMPKHRVVGGGTCESRGEAGLGRGWQQYPLDEM